MNDERERSLRSRLRREPSPSTVPGTLPVLFFGDLFSAEVATVGLNPSDQEYTDRHGVLLTGSKQRFATLASLGATKRGELTDEQCDEAVRVMRAYYHPDKPVYGWFAALGRVIGGLGASLQDGTAAHLDLVQEATHPTWSALPQHERSRLLAEDLPFLEWEIRAFPLRAVICTGKTASDHVRARLGVDVEETGEMARIRWWIGRAHVDGRDVGFAGWNYPLARPTGLGADGEKELGKLLGNRLRL